MTIRRHGTTICLLASTAVLAACGSVRTVTPTVEERASASPAASRPTASAPKLPPANSGRGGYYQDDGPGENPPDGLENVPDAEPKAEAPLPRANRPYTVFGKTYTPITDDRPFKQRGIGSWYGRKFHKQKTSSGEPYDMYKMTAAHPTLPIPSYARVTNLKNGNQVIVRVNDRGPFHANRIIDLSYTAALKLGYLGSGSGELEVERLLPDEIARINSARKTASQIPPAAVSAPVIAPSVERMAAPEEMKPVFPVAEAPSEAAVEPPKAVPVSIVSTPAGFYLQFGAFRQADNARVALDGYQKKWSAELPVLEMKEQSSVFRLFSGPFSSREDAEKAAASAEGAGLPKPMIVQR